ncbi:pyridoxal phosphate homeostasis protein [Anaeramoeba ignava]|uniref:Pyridoxal phosphate homeostasis protein n=1 Tax=Anaeramoeba ignava TaxID=1746090 RepID=A0A9Q0LMZ9_ANAIG|nr:pyridoxal phosphate homeostasis protein [Anaeramoeba ignava]
MSIEALNKINQQIEDLSKELNLDYKPNLVAISKTKPKESILILYESGQKHFGENYVQEIIEKAKELPKDIKWHFVGHLQSNKAKSLVQLDNLYVIETIDTIKLAKILNKLLAQQKRTLNIMIQVDISHEGTKSGCSENDLPDLTKFILEKCPNLKLIGLMSLGNPNSIEEFEQMKKLKAQLIEKFEIDKNQFDLSFGTSQDFEEAIKHGSNSVRIGTTLFGPRACKKK